MMKRVVAVAALALTVTMQARAAGTEKVIPDDFRFIRHEGYEYAAVRPGEQGKDVGT